MFSKAVHKYCKGIFALAVFVFSTNVFSHGGVTIENDRCLFRTERHLIHFTAYQPTFSKAKELCRVINSTSDTILVLDFVDEGLRKVPVSLVLEKQNSDKTFASYREVNAKTYPTGTTQLQLKEVGAGVYRLHASIQKAGHTHADDAQHSGYFQFTIKEELTDEGKSLYQKYNWLFYLCGFGLLVYFMSKRYRS